MTDVNNERPEGSPPPLIPPPVRSSARSTDSGADSSTHDIDTADTRDDADGSRSGEPPYVDPEERVLDDEANYTDDTVDPTDTVDRTDTVYGDDSRADDEPAATRAFEPVAYDGGDHEPSDAPSGDQPVQYDATRDDVRDETYDEATRDDIRDETYDEPAAVAVGTDAREERVDDVVTDRETGPAAPVAAVPVAATPVAATPVVEERVVEERVVEEPARTETQAQPVPVMASAPPQRTFLPAPVEPKKKGNRGVGSLIALLSVIVFAVLYALVAALIINARAPQGLGEIFQSFAVSPVFYVPAILFVVAFIIVVLLANRASWWAYVLGSLLVGAVVYFGTIGIGLLSENVVTMTPAEAATRFANYAVDPFVIAAALIAREVALWTGSAIAARGRRQKVKNLTAREEYERASAEHREQYERGYASTVS